MLTNVVSTWKLQYGPEALNVQDKTVLVLGGRNGGGRMTAELLASCGARVFAAAHSQAELSQMLEAIRANGGEGDGLVGEIHSAQEAKHLFAEAERCFGPVHAVINYLPLDAHPLDGETGPAEALEDGQNAITQEALLHLQEAAHGQIINIGQARNRTHSRVLAAALRRQAKDLGIRVTLVEPGETQDANMEDIVQCVMSSLVQPFGVDVIFMRSK